MKTDTNRWVHLIAESISIAWGSPLYLLAVPRAFDSNKVHLPMAGICLQCQEHSTRTKSIYPCLVSACSAKSIRLEQSPLPMAGICSCQPGHECTVCGMIVPIASGPMHWRRGHKLKCNTLNHEFKFKAPKEVIGTRTLSVPKQCGISLNQMPDYLFKQDYTFCATIIRDLREGENVIWFGLAPPVRVLDPSEPTYVHITKSRTWVCSSLSLLVWKTMLQQFQTGLHIVKPRHGRIAIWFALAPLASSWAHQNPPTSTQQSSEISGKTPGSQYFKLANLVQGEMVVLQRCWLCCYNAANLGRKAEMKYAYA